MEAVEALALVAGHVDEELLLRNEYLAAENEILRSKLSRRPQLTNPERKSLAKLGKQLGLKALKDVADDFRGRGIARELWRTARDTCREAGNIGGFTVNSSRFAVGTYRNFGFVETSQPVTKEGVTSIPMKLAGPDE
jgi:predicted GNAT family N-acyltransferase